MRLKFLCTTVLCAAMVLPTAGSARISDTKDTRKDEIPGPQRVLVLDGSTVHNVGDLQMFVGNWGNFGSRPGSANTFSEAPSAQWPAGSGVEYLYVAGLWVGAIKNGVAAVSVAAYQVELRPTQDERDIMYFAREGDRGGNRLPSRSADDDKDGMIDEDWLNGYDDDGDGQIDEDFAAVSKQMMSCQYNDFTPIASQIYPEHNPLNIHVRQESYQWEEDRFDDFVGANFWITNVGTQTLEDVYIGFFADCDAGARDTDNYWEDDATGFRTIPVLCTDLGPVSIDIAFTYDADGDNGETPGYFGVMFLGHTTDPTGELAPERVGISTYANFSGSASYEDGGDPSNDFERYELLSSQNIERDAQVPRDYRMLLCAGPFAELHPDSTLEFQTAFVIGAGIPGMVRNASSAQLTYDGAWFNLDGLAYTGVAGRETAVYGPAENVVIDSCVEDLSTPINWNLRTALYINNDCKQEELFRDACGYTESDSAKYKTGVAGNEQKINWIVGTAPPAPSFRVAEGIPASGDSYGGLAVIWDNFSESQPDVKTQKYDFEGYRIWRADGWNRPLGTSAENGPSHDLWKLLFEVDIVNGFGEDTGLAPYRYEPLLQKLTPSRRADLLESLKQYMLEFPSVQEPPCDPGLTQAECDTLRALAWFDLGHEKGRNYYRFVDQSVHLGLPYFYAVTAADHGIDDFGRYTEGKFGDPSSNFIYVEPSSAAQPAYDYDENEVYVVPNPATTTSMRPWTLSPNNDDPTGIKVEFRNLPRDKGVVRIYTLAGDLVTELPFDGRSGLGTLKWDLVSRNKQDVTSGVYLFSVETDYEKSYGRKIGKFVVIR